jgi:hypothetical protein
LLESFIEPFDLVPIAWRQAGWLLYGFAQYLKEIFVFYKVCHDLFFFFVSFLFILHKSSRNPTLREETGARGSVVVKALCYKPEGRGFDTR